MTEHCADQITWYLSLLTLHTTVVSLVQSLHVASRHGQATIYLFQKHLLYWECEYIVCRNGNASVKVKCCVLLVFSFFKNWTVTKKLQSPGGYKIMFLKCRENVLGCVCCCFLHLPACLFTPALAGIKLSYAGITYFCDRALVDGECLE